MKNSKAIVQKRQQTILQILQERNHVSTEHLAAELNVSNLTVRRDLQDLAGQGFVRIVRGGPTWSKALCTTILPLNQRPCQRAAKWPSPGMQLH